MFCIFRLKTVKCSLAEGNLYYRQTDRQTGRQAGRQADRQTDRQTDRQRKLQLYIVDDNAVNSSIDDHTDNILVSYMAYAHTQCSYVRKPTYGCTYTYVNT